MSTVSTTEIAARLGIQLPTVSKLAKEGKIRGTKIGGQWQFDANEAERFIADYLATNSYIKHMKFAPRADRFWAKVDKSGECWIWAGCRTKKGYGRFCDQGAHRVAYELTYGPIPPGMMACHTCDNPPCVRPEHLFLGTNEQNMHDMAVKGRANKNPTMIGENHTNAKLNSDKVRQIRDRVAFGANQQELAAEFGVSRSLISLVVRGEIWKEA